MAKFPLLSALLLAGGFGVTLAAPVRLAHADANLAALQSVLGSYNVYVAGNLGTAANPYNSDSQGSIAVGGNAWLQHFGVGGSLTVQNNLTFTSGSSADSILVGGTGTFSSVTVGTNLPAHQSALSVGSNLSFQSGQIDGNATIGGTASFGAGTGTTIYGDLNVDGGKPSPLPTVTGSSVFGAGAAKPTAVPNIASSFAALQAASTELATTLQSQGTLGNATNVYGQLDLTGTGSVNYFDISLSQLVGINGLDFITPTGSISIINVSGLQPTGKVLSNFSFQGNVDAATTLFNFTQATSLSLSGLSFDGSVLAPLATINAINGNFTGTVIAQSFGSQLNQDAQFNEAAFVGIPGQTAGIPEPTALSLLTAGLVAFGLLRRRAVHSA